MGTLMVTLRVNRPLVINKRRNWVPDTEVYWGEDSDDALRTWYNVQRRRKSGALHDVVHVQLRAGEFPLHILIVLKVIIIN